MLFFGHNLVLKIAQNALYLRHKTEKTEKNQDIFMLNTKFRKQRYKKANINKSIYFAEDLFEIDRFIDRVLFCFWRANEKRRLLKLNYRLPRIAPPKKS